MNLFRHLLLKAQFHGMNKLTERKYWYWWALSLALCFCAAYSIILATIYRFLGNPTYLVVSEKTNEKMNFPSVIVCPDISYPQYKIDAYLSELKYPPGMNESVIKPIIRQLAAFYAPDMNYSIADLMTVELFLDYNQVDVETASRNLGLSCEETILRELHALNRRMLSIEPPILTYEVGHNSGLWIVVNTSQELEDLDLNYKWVYLERGLQFVEIGGNGTPISPNEEFWLMYNSHRSVIQDGARELSKELRGCVMSQDSLEYFPSYSTKYCMIECEMRRTMERCHCARFTHPRLPRWSYCPAKSLLCVKNSAVPYGAKMCNCLPTCDTHLDWTLVASFPLVPGSYITDPFYDDLDFSKVSVVRAFILRYNTKTYERQSYYTSSQLFSQIGGTMNVFFGCSILTIVELLQLLRYGYKQYKIIRQSREEKAKKQNKPSTAMKKISSKVKNLKSKKAVKFRRRMC